LERIGFKIFFSKNDWNSGEAKKDSGSAKGCFFIPFLSSDKTKG